MIHLTGIGVKYRTEKTVTEALKNINLDIGVEFLGVVGPSGCGKTTLLRVLAGLIEPTEGKRVFDAESDHSYGIVFQDYSLLPWLTTQQNIELGLRVQGVPAAERVKVCQRLLYQLGLEDVAHHLPHQLSGGMRQRVAVGRAFAPSPSILLMDEPFGALDAITREELQEALTKLYESDPHTVVFVTHDVEEALLLSDRICVLTARPGKVRETINVPFDRPRKRAITRNPKFLKLKYLIDDVLREEKRSESIKRRSHGIS